MGCIVSIPSELTLPRGQEIILTWDVTQEDPDTQHTKREYIKILQDARYYVSYEIKWKHTEPTTQPLQATVYKVTKEYAFEALHHHITVCVGNPINLKKKFPFDLLSGERICIGVKNLSTVDFTLMNCQLSLTQI